MRISDWSSDVCSSDLAGVVARKRDDAVQQVFHRHLLAGRQEHGRTGLGAVPLLPGFRPDGEFLVQFQEIGRASCRERVCQYVLTSVVAVSLNRNSSNT